MQIFQLFSFAYWKLGITIVDCYFLFQKLLSIKNLENTILMSHNVWKPLS